MNDLHDRPSLQSKFLVKGLLIGLTALAAAQGCIGAEGNDLASDSLQAKGPQGAPPFETLLDVLEALRGPGLPDSLAPGEIGNTQQKWLKVSNLIASGAVYAYRESDSCLLALSAGSTKVIREIRGFLQSTNLGNRDKGEQMLEALSLLSYSALLDELWSRGWGDVWNYSECVSPQVKNQLNLRLFALMREGLLVDFGAQQLWLGALVQDVTDAPQSLSDDQLRKQIRTQLLAPGRLNTSPSRLSACGNRCNALPDDNDGVLDKLRAMSSELAAYANSEGRPISLVPQAIQAQVVTLGALFPATRASEIVSSDQIRKILSSDGVGWDQVFTAPDYEVHTFPRLYASELRVVTFQGLLSSWCRERQDPSFDLDVWSRTVSQGYTP